MTRFLASVAFSGLLLGSSADVPDMCALYFDFTHTNLSSMHFGEASDDGVFHQRADLGPNFDPQGRVTISSDGSSFAFTTKANATVGKHYGCCHPFSTFSVDIATGKTIGVASLHRIDAVKGCGLYGCGFLEIGGLNAQTDKLLAWVEPLMPPPPPAPTPALAPAPAPAARRTRTNGLGLALVEYDIKTGAASEIRPLSTTINMPNEIADGLTSFDDTGNMWFACQLGMTTEGVCNVEVTKSKEPAKVKMTNWTDNKLTITAMEYSRQLKAVVVLAQGLGNGTVPSALYTVDPKSASGAWTKLIELGSACQMLHQTSISSDGKYMMIIQKTGACDGLPVNTLVTVDLEAKKVVKKIEMKAPKFVSPLSIIPCQRSTSSIVV